MEDRQNDEARKTDPGAADTVANRRGPLIDLAVAANEKDQEADEGERDSGNDDPYEFGHNCQEGFDHRSISYSCGDAFARLLVENRVHNCCLFWGFEHRGFADSVRGALARPTGRVRRRDALRAAGTGDLADSFVTKRTFGHVGLQEDVDISHHP
jgi:hypothetical protein